MTNYREILRLHSLGLNKTEIAASLHCARNTVAATLQRAGNCGLQWPLPDEMSDRQLADRLFPSAPGKLVYKMPDYAYVYKEMQKSGVTLNLLWLEYCDQCKASGEIPYQSTQFNKYYSDYLNKTNATMHLNHKPGEIMQVDWAGDTASVIDTDTGEVIPAYVFVATLPYSGYSYVEAFFSMNQECWTAAHVNAYRYFGGVTRMIQCDNLKTGVEKHGKDEVVLNKSYQELAEHYATAIVPARVRAPKDKAAVEGTVGIISTFILAALRNRQFLSLPELNEAIWERLEAFNNKPFQKKNGSRASLFAEEKPFLRPLPPYPFELATWKKATVGPNYHISVERMNYSVPFEYIRQKVDIRLTRATVEVFYNGSRICSHPRLYGKFNQYSTIQEHMPPDHQKYVQWNGERFIRWAGKIGSSTECAVRAILSSYKVEQQGYGINLNGTPTRFKISEQWKFMLNAPFDIGAGCCKEMKKKPINKYAKETGRVPIVGTMAAESSLRTSTWLKYGCNAFDNKKATSAPLSFWTDSDIWEYIHKYNLPYCKVYDMGHVRTGCVFCMFGVHLDKTPNRFQQLQKTHPQLWRYCMKPWDKGGLGMREVLEYMGVPYENYLLEDE